jgi:bacteriocin biosynthesis cyclodehydratase domain-containing protein
MERPRLKSVFPPVPLREGVIGIGGVDHGFAAEIDDESGTLWQLLQLLDGSRSLDEVAIDMSRRFPDVSRSDVVSALADLAAAGYVEDAGRVPRPGAFRPGELERYDRNVAFFSYFTGPDESGFDVQERLKAARVAVVGLGGLGSAVALALASAGVGTLLVVDFDTVEVSNLNRQLLYTDDDVSRQKATVGAERLRIVNPHVSVESWDSRIDGIASAREVFDACDLVVCAADRPRILIHHWLNSASLLTGKPWMWGGNAGLTLRLSMLVPGATGCLECGEARDRSAFPWYDEARAWQSTEAGAPASPCIAPTAGMLGSIAALDVIKQVTGAGTPASYGGELVVDVQDLRTWRVETPPRADCPACGTAAAHVEKAS